ncbi:polyunsaturated fatty acid 5-lipoxygenase-like isoform X2 [Acropora muricata]|uniref:polyunsaturated fatty acid 5-lipoxygenase-like isoform X2 n=1 Tax=Acropora muricata TaxID=159855 RepID=UPI0034E5EDCB
MIWWKFSPVFVLSFSLSFGVRTRAKDSQPIPAPEKGPNVCAFRKTKTQFVLRRNATTTAKIINVDCGVQSFPGLKCKEERNETKIHWYPVRKVIHYNNYDCCPGWIAYQAKAGCKRAPCKVAIPQKFPAHCQESRNKDLQEKRAVYKLGHEMNLPFPLSAINLSLLINLTLADPFSKPWLMLYSYMLKLNRELIKTYPKINMKKFSKISDYEQVYHFFMKQQQENPTLRSFFRFPSQEEPFKSVINNSTWREDRVFVEQRLAGLNPMSLEKVTEGSVGVKWSELRKRLNMKFNWDLAVSKSLARNIKLEDAIKDGSIFVSQFPLFDNLPTVYPEIVTKTMPNRKMWSSMSPIALFVSHQGKNRAPAQLKPVAIQLDYTNDSPVRTADDGDMWLLAKESFQVTDYAYLEMVEHLLRTHLMMEPFCVCFLRHLSKWHPIHQLMKYHCRGLIITNKIGFPKLVRENGYMHQLFAIGNTGAIALLIRAYQSLTWADTDFRGKNKARGINDRSKLPYFPYRDDGELIYKAMEDLVNEYVNFYYTADQDVLLDQEMQSFATEISAELRGFPREIKTRLELKDIITRLIWTSTAQHTAVNYPIAAYGAYTPNMPTKLYDDDRVPHDAFNLYRFPNGVLPAVQAGVAMSLGSLRLDRLFDYGTQLQDQAGSVIVTKHYNRLHSVIKPLLDKRNKARLREGYLTYPYLSPAWIPNSICT